MLESKIHATERLRREGRWADASAYRDEVRKQLRAEGKAKSDASELAWEAMISKFAPQPAEVDGGNPQESPQDVDNDFRAENSSLC